MSSKSVAKKYERITIQVVPEEPINFIDIVIPFSEFGEKKEISDIYDGEKKIIFRESHSTYQTILKNEFTAD